MTQHKLQCGITIFNIFFECIAGGIILAQFKKENSDNMNNVIELQSFYTVKNNIYK